MLLLDVTPLSLGIETLGGVCTKLIDRNTTIPTKKSQIFSPQLTTSRPLRFTFCRASARWLQATRPSAASPFDGIAPAPRGIPQIEVTFDIDANGIVNVSAKDLGTGKEQKITITASTNLSQDEIDKAMHEAEQYAEQDKKNKEAVEVRNNAEQLGIPVREGTDRSGRQAVRRREERRSGLRSKRLRKHSRAPIPI